MDEASGQDRGGGAGLEPTLSREWYLSPAVFDHERERIFGHEWTLVARAEELAEPGTCLTIDLAGESLFLVRGRDQEIRAFFNVCRHRGCQLVAPAERSSPAQLGQTIQCRYHAWTYDLDGALRSAPFLESALTGRKHEFSLHQAGVAQWGGFLFVHLDPEGARTEGHTLERQIAREMRSLARYPLAELRIGRSIVYQVAANWKVILENYNECYHCAPIHPELVRLVPAFRQGGGSGLDWENGVPHREGAVTFTMTGQTNRAPFPGLGPDELVKHKGELIYPNMMISLSMDHVTVFRIEPEAVDRTRVTCDFLFHPTEIGKPDFDPTDAVDFWDLINRQDWAVCEAVQRGMRSRRFTHGYYAPMESASLDIRRYIRDRLEPEPPRPTT